MTSLVMALGPQAIEAHAYQAFGLHAPKAARGGGLASLKGYVQFAQSGSTSRGGGSSGGGSSSGGGGSGSGTTSGGSGSGTTSSGSG
ncbi:MAG TPA: hypothetical protein VHN39_16535, partial [Phenylobacterium sp.]|nr:hypothetical protein [Phenylobacterium sp.]